MKTYKTVQVLSLCLTALLLSACSGGLESQWGENSVSQSSTEEEYEQVPDYTISDDIDYGSLSFLEQAAAAGFSAGETLSIDTLPLESSSLSGIFAAYQAYGSHKAIAISSEGDIYFDYADSGTASVSLTQAESNRKALEGCYTLSIGQPCSIFAEKNAVKYNPQDFVNAMQASTLPVIGDAFSASRVPWVSNSARSGSLSSYGTQPSHKALAVNINGAGCYRSGNASEEEAVRQAVQCCEWAAKGRACVLFAIGNTVNFDITQHYYPSGLTFKLAPSNLDYASIPFVTDIVRSSLATNLANTITATATPVALALNGQGDWAYRTGATDAIARANALSACSATSAGKACLVYSVDNQVVLTLSQLRAL